MGRETRTSSRMEQSTQSFFINLRGGGGEVKGGKGRGEKHEKGQGGGKGEI